MEGPQKQKTTNDSGLKTLIDDIRSRLVIHETDSLVDNLGLGNLQWVHDVRYCVIGYDTLSFIIVNYPMNFQVDVEIS